MPPADSAKTRTVGDIMSAPVVVSVPDEKIAEAAARMREQRVGSVVVLLRSRNLTSGGLLKLTSSNTESSAEGTEPTGCLWYSTES